MSDPRKETPVKTPDEAELVPAVPTVPMAPDVLPIRLRVSIERLEHLKPFERLNRLVLTI